MQPKDDYLFRYIIKIALFLHTKGGGGQLLSKKKTQQVNYPEFYTFIFVQNKVSNMPIVVEI